MLRYLGRKCEGLITIDFGCSGQRIWFVMRLPTSDARGKVCSMETTDGLDFLVPILVVRRARNSMPVLGDRLAKRRKEATRLSLGRGSLRLYFLELHPLLNPRYEGHAWDCDIIIVSIFSYRWSRGRLGRWWWWSSLCFLWAMCLPRRRRALVGIVRSIEVYPDWLFLSLPCPFH